MALLSTAFEIALIVALLLLGFPNCLSIIAHLGQRIRPDYFGYTEYTASQTVVASEMNDCGYRCLAVTLPLEIVHRAKIPLTVIRFDALSLHFESHQNNTATHLEEGDGLIRNVTLKLQSKEMREACFAGQSFTIHYTSKIIYDFGPEQRFMQGFWHQITIRCDQPDKLIRSLLKQRSEDQTVINEKEAELVRLKEAQVACASAPRQETVNREDESLKMYLKAIEEKDEKLTVLQEEKHAAELKMQKMDKLAKAVVGFAFIGAIILFSLAICGFYLLFSDCCSRA